MCSLPLEPLDTCKHADTNLGLQAFHCLPPLLPALSAWPMRTNLKACPLLSDDSLPQLADHDLMFHLPDI